MKTTIPFSGFYNSIHDAAIDDVLEMEASDDHGEIDQDKFNDIMMKTDFQPIHVAYAKAYCERFAEETGITLKFEKLSSPKYYNFETDRIFADIELSEVERIFQATDKEKLEKRIKEKFTSRSGFHSFYPNSLTRWPMNLEEWDGNHIGTLIEVYAETTHDWSDEKELYLIDSPSEIVMPLLTY